MGERSKRLRQYGRSADKTILPWNQGKSGERKYTGQFQKISGSDYDGWWKRTSSCGAESSGTVSYTHLDVYKRQGCHVIIADGLKGTDEALVPVKGGEYVKEAKIGQAIMDADIIITLNHFKGHEATGFGGALKNIGMGCGSRAGKMEMHSAGKPYVDQELCIGCGKCTKICAHDAAIVKDKKARCV